MAFEMIRKLLAFDHHHRWTYMYPPNGDKLQIEVGYEPVMHGRDKHHMMCQYGRVFDFWLLIYGHEFSFQYRGKDSNDPRRCLYVRLG